MSRRPRKMYRNDLSLRLGKVELGASGWGIVGSVVMLVILLAAIHVDGAGLVAALLSVQS